jgi:CHAT domain-containing protein/Tfp pilus assembly protein PilF
MKLRKLIVFCGIILPQVMASGQTVGGLPANGPPTPAAQLSNKTLQTPVSDQHLATAEELNRLGSVAWNQGDLRQSEQYFRQALEIEQESAPDSLGLAESLNGLGDVTEKYGDIAKADEYYQKALVIAQKLDPDGLEMAHSLRGKAIVSYNRGNLAKAEEYFAQALAKYQEHAPGSLEMARSLDGLGLIHSRRGRRTKAEEFFRQALALREQLAPGSLAVATSYNYLGNLAALFYNVSQASESFQQAVAIQQQLAAHGLEFARSLVGLSDVALARSEPAKAETYLQEALIILKEQAPDGLLAATIYSRLSFNLRIRGNLEKAEEYERHALAIRQKQVPDSLDFAASLNSLGIIAAWRGDLATGQAYQQKALNIRERLNPDSPELMTSFWSMGGLNVRRGERDKADEFYRKALAVAEKIDPDGLMVAACQNTLSVFASKTGDLIKAEERQHHALEIQQKLIPRSGEVAQSLAQLGRIAERRGDLARAEEYMRQALAIREELAPGTMEHVYLLAALAQVKKKKQQPDLAMQFYDRVLTALEEQITHLGGGDEIRSDFRARNTPYYKEYIDLLMDMGRPQEAFQVLERSRARALLELLSVAKVDLQKSVDPVLMERQRMIRESLASKTNGRIQLLSHNHSDAELAAFDKAIAELLAESHQVEALITARSPRYTALVQSHPLSATQVQQQLLDGDTLLLEYSLGENRSYAFAVSASSITSYILPGRDEIEKAARRVYDLLTIRNATSRNETAVQRQARWTKAETEYPKAAEALSKIVLGPLAAELTRKRLLIVSDGMLDYIPFSALPAPRSNVLPMIPLVVMHEIVTLPSASVLAVLRQQAMGRNPAPKAVAVLADPVFDKRDSRITQRRPSSYATTTLAGKEPTARERNRSWSVVDGKLNLPRLPFSRREAQAIMAVTPAGQGMRALDFQANRSLATSPQLGLYRIVHFATHGLVDSDHPDLSGLVLSMYDSQGRPQNGFLELQDIYNLDLPVELVVLSSCETGLGKQTSGEGLVGLTRGFMYAGASRVVASLWNVSDAATATLMASFYKAMEQQKKSPAEALRAAQIEMWKQTRWSFPYFWAAFQIQGEWK